MKPFEIFNAEVNNRATKVFGGTSSGLCDWGDLKYPMMLDLHEVMFGELWSQNEIHLNSDLKQYRKELNDREKYVYNVITGYLTLLDSIADKFNFLIGFITSDASVQQNAQLIGTFEGLHNRSYQYLTATMLNDLEKKEAFNAPKNLPLLIKRNEHVIKPMEDFITLVSKRILTPQMEFSKEELECLFKALLANLVLEGIFFTGGFTYFHSLARENRMIGSNDMINLIKEDELHHNKFYGQLLKIVMSENPELNTTENLEFAVDYMKKAVELEKEWADSLFVGIETLSMYEYSNYVEYLANLVASNAGISTIYHENKEIRSAWIVKFGQKSGVVKADIFESDSIDYGHEDGGNFDF